MAKEKKRYTISIPVKTFWLIFMPLLLLLGSAGALCAFLIVDRYVMPQIVGVHRDMVTVPNVYGMPLEDARNAFFAVGLLSETRGREFNEEVAEGSIISQQPVSGESVKKGRRISVTVSRGNEVATIPQVRGMNERQARNELRRHGFNVGTIRRDFSNNTPLDAVMFSDPAGETTTSRALDVALVISRGPRPTHADVPNLIGESLASARAQIEEAGLKVGRVTTQTSTVAPGSVISQSTAPGSRVPFEASIDLVVSAQR